MSKQTKAQLVAELRDKDAVIEQLEKALLEAQIHELRSYELMFARGTAKQSRNTIANIAVALSRNGKVGITGVIATVTYNTETEKAELKPIGVKGYNFFGFADPKAAQKLADYVLWLASYDQIPDTYKVKFHGKNMGKVVNQLKDKTKIEGSKVEKALS